LSNGVAAKAAGEAGAQRVYRDRDQLRFLIVVGTVCGDIAVISVAALVASWLRYGNILLGNPLDLLAVLLFPYLLAATLLEGFQIERLRKRAGSIRRAVMAFVVSFVFAVIAAFAFKVGATYSRLETGYLVSLAILGLILWRAAFSSLVNKQFAAVAEPVVVVLGDFSGLADDRLLEGAKEMFDVGERGWAPRYDDPDFLNHLSYVIGDADRVILSFSDDQVRHDWIFLAHVMGLNAEVWQSGLVATRPLGLNALNGASTLIVSRGPLQFHERFIKRVFDLGLTIPGLFFFLPVMLLISALIKLESPGPVLFVQKRIGGKNRYFSVYKFRTMQHKLTDEMGSRSATKGDERLTRIGHFLRVSSLDELPQLINVLKGDMSLVGPRPHPIGMRSGGKLNWFAVDEYWNRHAVKPGITGLAQIRGYRGNTVKAQDLKNRVDADIEYMNHWSIFLDLRILIKTIAVLIHHNAY